MNKFKQTVFRRLALASLLSALVCTGAVRAQGDAPVERTTRELMLGQTAVRIVIYEKKGSHVTFFSPHHNEQIAIDATREVLAKRGGRLVVVESLDEQRRPTRRLRFLVRGQAYSLDPNRIFTPNGRRCAEFTRESETAVASFAGELLKILLAQDGTRLRDGERVIIAVHNNTDVDGRSPADRASDLTAASFVRAGGGQPPVPGAFHDQAAGVFLSNLEGDEDNFILLSTPAFLSFFAERGFNVVLQKPASMLRGADCAIDDGSLSVFSSFQNIPYINLEADAQSGGLRQRQMLEAVYQLLPALASKDGAPTAPSAAK